MKYLSIFPHIYIRKTSKGLILYNTNTGCYFHFDSSHHLYTAYDDYKIVVNTSIIDYCENDIDILIKNDFGYLIDCEVPPLGFHNILFTSSLNKLDEVIQYRDTEKCISLLEKISLSVDSSENLFNNDIFFDILRFPKESIEDDTIIKSFINSIHFANLSEIEIVSLLTNKSENLFKWLVERYGDSLCISFRTICSSYNEIKKFVDFSESFPKSFFKLYIPVREYANANLKTQDNLKIYLYSDDIVELTNCNFNNIIPILHSEELQPLLYKQLKISKNEIFYRLFSIKELKIRSQFNMLFWGSISVSGNSFFCGTQKIGSLSEFRKDLTDWLYSTRNIWFSSRRNKDICKDCVFADFCPSITIFELLGIIDKPCDFS